MVNKRDWMSYVKTMKSDDQDFLNFKQYKYIHSQTAVVKANMPQYIRAKKLRKLGRK